MAKSVRISDELYELAQFYAALHTRSLAQQLEHWAKLGVATADERSDLGAALAQYRHATLEAAVRAGRISARALHVIPEHFARDSALQLPAGERAVPAEGW